MMARRLNSKSPRVPRACRLRTYSPSNERLPAAGPGLTRHGQRQLHFTNMQNGRPDRIGTPVLLSCPYLTCHSHSWLCALHWRTAIAQRRALGHFQLQWWRTSVCHHAFPIVSRSQTDDQELVFVVRLAAV